MIARARQSRTPHNPPFRRSMVITIPIYSQGEFHGNQHIADPGKFLLNWYDLDTTPYCYEGTWREISEFIACNIMELKRTVAVLSNDRDEILTLDIDGF